VKLFQILASISKQNGYEKIGCFSLVTDTQALTCRPILSRHFASMMQDGLSSIDMYNNDVGKKSAQKFMKQTGDLKAATLYFAS
jgi:hypothetical protein